jgi:UrcA family protein
MKHNLTTFRSSSLALLVAGAMISGTVLAADTLEEVTVQGSRVAKQVIGRDPANGTPIERVALTRAVDYSDLDLSTTLGSKEMANRVAAAAKTVCEELNKLFPMMAEDPTCIKRATDEGMKKADKVIMAHATAKKK